MCIRGKEECVCKHVHVWVCFNVTANVVEIHKGKIEVCVCVCVKYVCARL